MDPKTTPPPVSPVTAPPPRLIQCDRPPAIPAPLTPGALAIAGAIGGGGLLLRLVSPAGSWYARYALALMGLGAAIVVAGVAPELMARPRRAAARREATRLPGSSPSDEAWHHTLRVRGRRGAAPIDAAEWRRTLGPGAVTFGVPIPPPPEDGEPIAEPVDVGPGRRRWRVELGLRTRITAQQVGLVLLLLGMAISLAGWALAGAPLTLSPGSPSFTLIVIAPTALFLLASFGYRPIELTSAIAEPGRLVTVAWGRRSEFTRNDSVLVLEPSGRAEPPQVLAVLARDDGRQWRHLYSGPDDPGLADLYYRWMAEPATPAARRREPADESEPQLARSVP